MRQKTLKSPVYCRGIGLHSGKDIELALKPAPVGSGIFFVRSDFRAEHSIIRGDWRSVIDTTLCTKIGNEWHATIGTIEHLMAALAALHITNLIIEVNGPEIPAMDGSAQPFIEMMESVGVLTQPATALSIQVLKEIRVEQDDAWAVLRPADTFKVDYFFDFTQHCPSLGKQYFQKEGSTADIMQEIAAARTIGFLHEYEYLKSKGLALGGSLENAVVYDRQGVINPEGLRFADESVRHKALDAIGDLYLSGGYLQAHFIGNRSGHRLNHQLLQKLFADEHAWRAISIQEAASNVSSYRSPTPEWHYEPVFCVA